MPFNDASRKALDNAKWNQLECHILGHLAVVSLMEAIFDY